MAPPTNNDEFVFTTETQEQVVKIDGKDYLLKEASGGMVNQYRNAVMTGTTLGSDGRPVRILNLGDANSLLVSFCFFSTKELEGKIVTDKLVGIQQLKLWPARIQESLIARLKEISDLEDQESTERELFLEACKRNDCPIDKSIIFNWVEILRKEDEKFQPLVDFFKPEIEELVKNE